MLFGSSEVGVVGECKDLIGVCLEVVQEFCLVTTHFGEFDGNQLFVHLQDSYTHFGFLFLVSLAFGYELELNFVLILAYFGRLNLHVVAKVVDQGLFNHVWIIGRVELSILGEDFLVLVQGLRWSVV